MSPPEQLPLRMKVAFVDDHPVLLAGMASLFSNRPDFEVIATGFSADCAIRIATQEGPDLLLMDLSMPGRVYEAIATISRMFPKTKVLVFTAFSSADAALQALDAGATGFVLKGSTFDELFEAIHAVLRGQLYITREYASQVLNGLRNRASQNEASRGVKLSVREVQILEQLLHARTNREIATTLSISEKTVKHYMTGLMNKLNARNRVEVVIAAQQQDKLSKSGANSAPEGWGSQR
jgi:two-component system nitrate/nitrite response regulator NarL